jgi:hypothetical protein
MRPESLKPLHPVQGEATQRAQLRRLGSSAEEVNVLAHGILNGLVVWQGRALRQTELTDGMPLGRAVLQPLLDNQPRSSSGNFFGGSHGADCARKRQAVPTYP